MKKKILIGVIIVIAIGAVIGATSGGSNSTTAHAKTTSSDSAKVSTAKKKGYTVGDTVNVDGKEITVNKVTTSNGDDMDTPQKGNDYVVVDVTIKNASDSNISYNPFNYTMQNSKGQITDGALATIDQNTSLNSGDLTPGGSVSGTMVFEAPKGDKGLKLLYTETLSSKPNATINLY